MNWKLIRHLDRFIGIPLIRLSSVLTSRDSQKITSGIPPKRILLIKFWGIGNIFMMAPSVQALRTTWPDSAIDILTLTSNRAAAEIISGFKGIYCINTSNTISFITSVFSAIRELRHNRYDIVIDFEQFARFSPLIVNMLHAAQTIGFSTAGQHRHQLYTDSIEYDNAIHITRSFYQLVKKATVTLPYPASASISCTADNNSILRELSIPLHKPLAVIHIGTSNNFMERRWPPLCYSELCTMLTQKHCMTVVLTGLTEERHLIQATIDQLKNNNDVIDCSGRLTFRHYYTLIAAASLVISADTAAVHIASVLNIPVAGLYGPNTPTLYGPWGEQGVAITADFGCSPCITNFNAKINTCRHPLGHGACMRAITVPQVYDTLLANRMLPPATNRKKQ